MLEDVYKTLYFDYFWFFFPQNSFMMLLKSLKLNQLIFPYLLSLKKILDIWLRICIISDVELIYIRSLLLLVDFHFICRGGFRFTHQTCKRWILNQVWLPNACFYNFTNMLGGLALQIRLWCSTFSNERENKFKVSDPKHVSIYRMKLHHWTGAKQQKILEWRETLNISSPQQAIYKLLVWYCVCILCHVSGPHPTQMKTLTGFL